MCSGLRARPRQSKKKRKQESCVVGKNEPDMLLLPPCPPNSVSTSSRQTRGEWLLND